MGLLRSTDQTESSVPDHVLRYHQPLSHSGRGCLLPYSSLCVPLDLSDPLFLFLSGKPPKTHPSSASIHKHSNDVAHHHSPDGLNHRSISLLFAPLFKPLVAVASSYDLARATLLRVAAINIGRSSLVHLAAPHPPISFPSHSHPDTLLPSLSDSYSIPYHLVSSWKSSCIICLETCRIEA